MLLMFSEHGSSCDTFVDSVCSFWGYILCSFASHRVFDGTSQRSSARLSARLVDELHWLLAPVLLGEEGRAAVGALEVRRLAEAGKLCDVRTRRLGDDFYVWGALAAPKRRTHT